MNKHKQYTHNTIIFNQFEGSYAHLKPWNMRDEILIVKEQRFDI
jgi:hypothetical protein